MRHSTLWIPMNLQMFAADSGGSGGSGGAGGAGDNTGGATEGAKTGGAQDVAIDYDRLAQLIAGKQSATEDSVLRGYFKQQGLSAEEMTQAIAAFKEQKAKNTPDPAALQQQAQSALAAAQKAQIESAATLMAVSLGVDAKTVPYILKMADFSAVLGQDGKISDEALKTAVNKVLEDVPALKPQPQGAQGFQVGASGGDNPAGTPAGSQSAGSSPVPTKRWNRFNN